jgi:hypothetical protein
MTFIWQAICAALFPADPANIRKSLERFLAHLARWSNRKRARHATIFLRNPQANAPYPEIGHPTVPDDDLTKDSRGQPTHY